MLLTADIGNTSITFGLYNDDLFIRSFRLATNPELKAEDYKKLLAENIKDCSIQNCIIASVVNDFEKILKLAIDELFGIKSIIATKDIVKDLKIDLDKPETVGMDRILNVVATKDKYPLPALVVDIGTAITFDFIDKQGAFSGGAIMPGINLQLKALNLFTSKLPIVDIQESENVMAKNTEDAIRAGVIRGIGSAINGMVEQYEKECGEKITLIATGGQAEFLSKYVERKIDFIDKELTLAGLKILNGMC